MPKSTTAKSIPVEVREPAEDCATFKDLRDEGAAVNKKLDTLKPRILELVPSGQDKEEIEATRNNVKGRYIITKIVRQIINRDDDKLIEVIKSKGRIAVAKALEVKTVINDEGLNALVEQEIITPDDLKECITITRAIYPTVDFKPTGTKA